jgi:hypothetical protein
LTNLQFIFNYSDVTSAVVEQSCLLSVAIERALLSRHVHNVILVSF